MLTWRSSASALNHRCTRLSSSRQDSALGLFLQNALMKTLAACRSASTPVPAACWTARTEAKAEKCGRVLTVRVSHTAKQMSTPPRSARTAPSEPRQPPAASRSPHPRARQPPRPGHAAPPAVACGAAFEPRAAQQATAAPDPQHRRGGRRCKARRGERRARLSALSLDGWTARAVFRCLETTPFHHAGSLEVDAKSQSLLQE